MNYNIVLKTVHTPPSPLTNWTQIKLFSKIKCTYYNNFLIQKWLNENISSKHVLENYLYKANSKFLLCKTKVRQISIYDALLRRKFK